MSFQRIAFNPICRTTSPRFSSRWFAWIIALGFLAICFQSVPLSAQEAPSPRARVTFADNTSVTLRGNHRNDQVTFPSVEIHPRERITIELKLPSRFASLAVGVQALDGGRVSGDVVIDSNGIAAFDFRTGGQPGLYRVLVSAGSKSATLRFTVPRPANP